MLLSDRKMLLRYFRVRKMCKNMRDYEELFYALLVIAARHSAMFVQREEEAVGGERCKSGFISLSLSIDRYAFYMCHPFA